MCVRERERERERERGGGEEGGSEGAREREREVGGGREKEYRFFFTTNESGLTQREIRIVVNGRAIISTG